MTIMVKLTNMNKNQLLKICKIMNISTNNTMKKKMLIELLLYPLTKSRHSYKMRPLKQPSVFIEGVLPERVSHYFGLSRGHPSLYCSYVKSKKIGYGQFKNIYDINCDYYCSAGHQCFVNLSNTQFYLLGNTIFCLFFDVLRPSGGCCGSQKAFDRRGK